MNQSKLAKLVCVVMVGIGICGLITYLYVIPVLGRDLCMQMPEYSHCYRPWLYFLWLTSIPCYVALYYGCKIGVEIGKDNSFSLENARYLKRIMAAAIVNSVIFFAGNIIYLLLDMNHPGIVIISLMVCFGGLSISIIAAVLAHLVENAAEIRRENESYV